MKYHKPYGAALITPDMISSVSDQAKISSRRRKNLNLHQLEDRVQRMLNALEPDSYVRPHRHISHPKPETFIVLSGRFVAGIFDDTGRVIQASILSASGNRGMDILPGTWHSIIALEPGSVFFEAKEGPYDPDTDKEFAEWAPPESEGKNYLREMRSALLRASQE
jgi:cupin fold WbuC family metalloprotein